VSARVYARKMKAFRAIGFLTPAIIAGASYAHWAPDAFSTVPVDRLLTNLEKYVQENPKDARGYFALGRVHSLAYARDIQSVTVWNYEMQNGKRVPARAPIAIDSAAGPRDPRKGDSAEAREHLIEAIGNLKKSTELDPTQPVVFLGLAWVLEQGSAMAYDLGLPPGYDSVSDVPATLTVRSHGSNTVYKTEWLLRKWRSDASWHYLIVPALEENVDALAPLLFVELRYSDSIWIRAEVARLLTLFWERRALEAYRLAYRPTVAEDLKAPMFSPGHELVSAEAGEGILRTLPRCFPADQITAEVREVRNAVKRLREKTFPITPIIFSTAPEFALRDLLAEGRTTPFDLDGTGRTRQWS